jgi:TolB-like protein/tetratricopeptide (TPR) repeat protein
VVEESDGDLMGDGVNIAARLEGIAAPGTICLSEQAYWQVKSRLDLAVSDLGATQLKNIAEPIRVYSLEVGRTAQVKQAAASTPPRLSVVVLPFANLGGDPEQEYFVDGVSESLTTDLSRISGSFVIGRNTAFTYKGKHVDLKQIGRELNVRYVLEGSIQRTSNRLRVNVQLIDAENGAHLWAERFDKPVVDLFDMQDEIVARLANQLGAQLVAVEARRAQHAPHLDSMDLYFQGVACLNKGSVPEHVAQASEFFERALALDPSDVDALLGSAFADVTRAGFLGSDRDAALSRAEGTLTKVLSSVPDHALAHLCLAHAQIQTNRVARGIAECERALALNPNLAAAHAAVGWAKIFLGRADETEGHIKEALRLSPRDTFAHSWMAGAGFAKLLIGADEEALALLHRAIETNRNNERAHLWLAALLALAGQQEQARAAADVGLRLNPSFTISRARVAGALSDNPTYLAQRERVLEGMRMAGVPET